MDVAVITKTTKTPVYADRIKANEEHLELIGTGVFASTDDLQELAESVLDRGIDRVLDKPEFIRAVADRSH